MTRAPFAYAVDKQDERRQRLIVTVNVIDN